MIDSSSDQKAPPQQSAGPCAVVIPAYNHGETVAAVIGKTLLQQLPVIVVDDGSTDETYKNIQSIPGIRILRHRVNRGKGAALVTGMREAAKIARWAVCLDADGQHDPDDIGSLLAAIPTAGSAILIGKREGMESAPWTSRFGRKFSNFWIWVSGAPLLSDSQSGFRLYPLPEVLDLNIRAGRYQYELEVLVKAAWKGIPILEVPVRVSYAPFGPRISHFDPWRDFLRNTRTFSRLITRRVLSPWLWNRHRKNPAPEKRH
jgi:glycosyltransferase involved in cell wall biosynthesis